MVEHTSAQTTQHQEDRDQQSFDAAAPARWYHHPHRGVLDATPRFSLFRWFKRRNSTSSVDGRKRQLFRKKKRRPSVTSCSSSSDTSYSTSTVRSFAYHSGLRPGVATGSLKLEQSSCVVGPFAPGAVKLRRGDDAGSATCTLPTGFSRGQGIQTRYLLHPFNNSYISFDNIPFVSSRPRAAAAAAAESRKKRQDVALVLNVDTLTSDSSASVIRKVHVKGKRRAPEPPIHNIISVNVTENCGGSKLPSKSRRKRRPAPKPPGYGETLSSNQDTLSSEASTGMESLLTSRDCPVISNDTLVLRRGVLLSKRDISSTSKSSTRDSEDDTVVNAEQIVINPDNGVLKVDTLMPRPWYKRSVLGDHSNSSSRESTSLRRNGGGDILRGLPSPLPIEVKDELLSSNSVSPIMTSSFPFDGSLSRLSFFSRGDRFDEKKKENKRKSGVSILTNISELDREAAAIVQEEQARNRASMLLQAAKLDEDFERRMGANKDIVEEIVNASMENSPRRGTRALISKFNALGNITKVTVNTNFFTRNSASPKPKNKRFSQQSSHRENYLDDRLGRDLTKYFLSQQSAPKRDSATIFTEIIHPGKPKAAINNPKPSMELTTVSVKPKIDEKNDAEFVNSLAAELDDVATGIARLRRELDERPKLIGTAVANRDKSSERKKYIVDDKKANASRGQDLANFDQEYTKIFNEIDRQLRTRDSTVAQPKSRSDETSISNQVAKVLDILIAAEKNNNPNDVKSSWEASKNITIIPIKPTEDISGQKSGRLNNTSKMSENSLDKKRVESSAVKNILPRSKNSSAESITQLKVVMREKKEKNVKEPVAVVQTNENKDDKAKTDLKEIMKDTTKHSLPKELKPKKSTDDESKPVNRSIKLSDIIDKPFTSLYQRIDEATAPTPKASTKVSSGVQTSGNIRKIGNGNSELSAGRSKDNKLTSENARSSASSPAKPKEYVIKIEPTRGKTRGDENAYANVMERSLYANAQVAPSITSEKEKRDSNPREKINLQGSEINITASPRLPRRNTALAAEKNNRLDEEKKLDEDAKKQYMNTMAVNRLLRKLEAAIASGNHQQAAVLARELAQLKIHCSVVRQRSCGVKEKLNLKMYIEDKQAHQGPIPLQLPVNMTVAQLKAKIHIEFEIPANVQRWIIGKNLADNDESTLEELQAVEGSPIFLYLVAPPDFSEKEIAETDNIKNIVQNKELATELVLRNKDEIIHDFKTEIKDESELETKSEAAVEVQNEPQTHEEKEGSLSKEEKLRRYEELMSLENCDVIANTEPIECPICFMFTIEGEGVILRDCLHSFCRSCVANVVRYCEEAEVKCPYRDANYTCDSTLQEREIKALVPAEVYQQHLDKSISQAENNAGNNAFHCKTPDCPGWCIYDDNVNNFLCPVCKVNNCLTCQAIHMGKNCRQYQEELKYSKDTDHESKTTAAMLEEMVDRGEALPCPTCAVVLMKKWGCDWLRCSMCKTEICWVTRGPRWGPGGKGDTSGGCKCGENGVKCHPRCNYCH